MGIEYDFKGYERPSPAKLAADEKEEKKAVEAAKKLEGEVKRDAAAAEEKQKKKEEQQQKQPKAKKAKKVSVMSSSRLDRIPLVHSIWPPHTKTATEVCLVRHSVGHCSLTSLSFLPFPSYRASKACNSSLHLWTRQTASIPRVMLPSTRVAFSRLAAVLAGTIPHLPIYAHRGRRVLL